MREGYYSDKYFVRAREILLADHRTSRVTMQVFGKSHAYLGGMDEAIAILKLCADDWTALTVRALYDGEQVEPWETVMTIEGPYEMFAHLETLYLGVLARRTRVGTNTRAVVEAAHPKTVMFFPARHDHWLVQTGDGYAAHIAGAIGVSTDAQASWWGSTGIGTVPHALIAAYDGDTVLATKKFAEYIDPAVQIITLVDYENDCVRTSLEVARAMRRAALGRSTRYLGESRRRIDHPADGELSAHGGEPAARLERPERARRGRVSRDTDHGLRRIHGGEDPRLRGGRRASGLLRHRLLAVLRAIRLHGGHRVAEWRAAVEGGAARDAESPSRTRRLSRMRRTWFFLEMRLVPAYFHSVAHQVRSFGARSYT